MCGRNLTSFEYIPNNHFVSSRKNQMDISTNIREEVNHYLENADERMLKIVHAILEADANEDFWDELPSSVQENIHTAINQSEQGLGKTHEAVMDKYKKHG